MDLTYPTETYGIKNHHAGSTAIQSYGKNQEGPTKILSDFQRRLGKNSKGASKSQIEEALLDWGKEKSLIIAFDFIKALPLIADKTAEHQVFVDKISRRAVKILKPGKYGMTIRNPEEGIVDALFEEYLERIALTNHIFGTDIAIDGITIVPDELWDDEPGTPTLVTSQEWHIQNSEPSDPYAEISKFMQSLNFKPGVRTNQWQRFDNIYIADAKEENFIFTTEGPRPVDLLVSRVRT